MNNRLHNPWLGISFFMVLLISLNSAEGRIVYVSKGATGTGDSWDNALTTITAGLTAAASGDSVWVKSATYKEAITLKAGVRLYGGFAGRETSYAQRNLAANETIIDASGLNSVTVRGTGGALIDGFTITGGYSGVECYYISCTVANCRITANSPSTFASAGVVCYRSSITLANCTITGNKKNGAVYCEERSSVTLTNCTITGNFAQTDMGVVSCKYTSSATLTNCILWNRGMEIYTDHYSPSASVRYSCVQGGWPGEGNIDAPPLFFNAAHGDYRLQDHSPCIDRGTVSEAPPSDAMGNPRPGGDVLVDMGAYESPDAYVSGPDQHPAVRFYVRSDASAGGDGLSWDTAFKSLTAALDASWTSDEIWVKGGRYLESIALEPGVSLYGGFTGTEIDRGLRDWTANETIIDATGLISSVVIGANQSLLDGFIITGSRQGSGVWCYSSSPTLMNCIIVGNTRRGGISCDSSSPLLMNCTITANSADFGGGMNCKRGSSPTLKNCTITNNNQYGVYCTDTTPTLTDCIINDNLEGGVRCDNSSLILTHCTISGNSSYNRAGVYCVSSTSVLTNCTITGNSSRDAGGVGCSKSSLTLANCIIAGNTGEYGGGMRCYESSVSLRNCTIADNTAIFGAGMNIIRSTLNVINSVVWNQGVEFLTEDTASTLSVRFSCVQGGASGDGNIDGLPLFVDPAHGDYRLLDHSPCVDRGLVSAAPATDALGNPRPGGDGLVDMGAYESPFAYTPGPAHNTKVRWYVRTDATTGGDGRSWDTALKSLAEALAVASPSDEIWVKQDRYMESINLEPGVSLYGGFSGIETTLAERNWPANKTIIDATGVKRPTVIGADGSTLDGFIVTGGNETSYENAGGGVICYKSSPTLVNCTISGNAARNAGGGIDCYFASPRIMNCTISGNATLNYYAGGGVRCYSASPTLINCTITSNRASSGGGMLCDRNSFPTLTNCTITGNSAQLRGGGVYCNVSSPRITNCTIADNTVTTLHSDKGSSYGGGGVYCDYIAAPTLTNCAILRNTAPFNGGGIFCNYESSPLLIGCTISDNTMTTDYDGNYGGGGLFSRNNATPTLIHCTLNRNSAILRGGGVYCYSSSPVLRNCTLSGNSVTSLYDGSGADGGGINCYFSSPTLTNCTITGNSAVRNGGALSCTGNIGPILSNCTISGNAAGREGSGVYDLVASPTLTNCILWNEGSASEIAGASTVCIYSNIRGGYPGIGNISDDPLFILPWNGTTGDFHLLPGSPCIDAGDPSIFDGCMPPGLGTDRSDMGVYGGPGNCGWSSGLVPATLTLH